MNIYSLVYASSAVRPFSEEELTELLAIARTNNDRLGISGILLYADGNFLQVLEGEKSAVESLFDKISEDPRHRGVIRMISRQDSERNFNGWSMGFKRLSKDDALELLPGFNDMLNQDAETPPALKSQVAKSIWSLLMSFRQVVKT